MLKSRNAISLLLLAGCAADAAPATFTMCSSNPRNTFTIDIYFSEGRGRFEDYSQPVEICEPGSACVRFPILVSAPPRMPSAQETVRWQVGVYQFSIKAEGASSETYILEAFRPATGRVGTVWPSPAQRYSGRYSSREGLLTWTSRGYGTEWSRCAGRLTFREIGWLVRQQR